jgi:hypothetical protein
MAASILDQINAVPWRNFPQPEWNHDSSVPDALVKVVRGERNGYDCLLRAVGNNHAGTYYPVLLPALPLLGLIIHSGSPSAQRIALCVLDDLATSFHSDPSHKENAGGQDAEMEFMRQLALLRPHVQSVVAGKEENAQLASELLLVINERAA